MRRNSTVIPLVRLLPAFLLSLYAGTSRGQARDLLEPDVMLLIDSSGSMDWRDNTGRPEGLGAWDWARQACEAGNSSPEARTSWQKMQDAFLGKFNPSTYKCAVHKPTQRPSLHALRDETISDYVPNNITEFGDVSYPHFFSLSCSDDMWHGGVGGYDQCIDDTKSVTLLSDGLTRCYTDADNLYGDRCLNMHPEADPRQNNGILSTFGANVRFGAMTYDNLPKCWGDSCGTNRHATRWDYGHYRHWRCGGIDDTTSSGIGDICYDWNAGARGGKREGYTGAVGGLVGIGHDAESSNDEVADLLDSMEPLFCSPVGALIDDAGYYFANDPRVMPVSDFNTGDGEDRYYRCRPKIALLITDGQPTDVFEFPAGTCTGDGLAVWDPINANVSVNANYSRINHENRNGPTFRNPADDSLLDNTIFDCPWRSSPEEAGEIFDVGVRALKTLGVNDTPNCVPPDCWPLLTVVVGFNVPDDDEIDCEANPESCYYYTPSYERCWKGLPECTSDTDGGADDKVCAMTPRQFLNEIACQGWPYDTASTLTNDYGSGGQTAHATAFMPPWLNTEENDFCADGELCRRADDGSWVERALFVQDVDELAAVLDLILVAMSSNVVTRTDVVAWNLPTTAGFDPDAVGQYEFRSGYVARAGRPWKGVLTRVDKTCQSASTYVHHNVAQMIANQGSSRNILSYYSETPSYSQADPNLANLTQWLDQSVISELKDVDSDSDFDSDCAFGVGEYLGNPAVCNSQTDIADLIREETLNRGLADIFNSTPTILGPPYDRIASASYNMYRTAGNGARDPYLFVGTNDGVLHAIDLNDISADSGAAPEKWGFIPKSLLNELFSIYPIPQIRKTFDEDGTVINYAVDTNTGTGLYRHEFLMDGSPVARDVLLVRSAGAYSDTDEALAWRAVVFGSSGRNARTHYALDVTDTLIDPDNEKPKLRYEINPDYNMYGNNDTDGEAALDEMGMPIARPALAYVRETVGTGSSVDVVVAAAVVPGGYKADPDPNAADPEKDGNTGVYVLRLADGKVIRYLDPQDDVCPNSAGLIYEEDDDGKQYWDGAQLIGEPIVPHGTRSLNVTTHAYIGDDRGRLWLIDMYDKDPDNWCLSLYFDTLISWHYPYEDCVDSESNPCEADSGCVWMDCCKEDEGQLPCDYLARNMRAPRALLIGAPAISVNDKNQDVLVFGTGQYDELTNWNRNRIFSLTDTSTVVESTEVVNNVDVVTRHMVHTPTINWWMGDPVPADDPFAALPSSASTTKNYLMGIETAMKTDTRVAPTSYPVPTEGPQAFWNVGEKLIGRPVVFDQVVYFTTFVPLNNINNTTDACGEGASRVWALDYDTYDSTAENTDANYIGKFFADDEWVPFYNYNNEVLSGVKVVKKPRCSASDDALFELVVQKANTSVDTSGSGAPPADAVESRSIPLSTRSDTSLVSVRFDSWSIVF